MTKEQTQEQIKAFNEMLNSEHIAATFIGAPATGFYLNLAWRYLDQLEWQDRAEGQTTPERQAAKELLRQVIEAIHCLRPNSPICLKTDYSLISLPWNQARV